MCVCACVCWYICVLLCIDERRRRYLSRRQAACCRLDYRWPAKCLTRERSRPQRWQRWEHYPPPPLPVYNGHSVWSMACVPVDPGSYWATHTHTSANALTHKQPASHKGQETRGAPQETPRSHTLTLGSITEAWLDVWYIHHLVQIRRNRDAELSVCGTCRQRLSHNKLPAPITQRILWTWIKILQPVIDWMPPTSHRISRCPSCCPSLSCDLMYLIFVILSHRSYPAMVGDSVSVISLNKNIVVSQYQYIGITIIALKSF